MKTNLVILFTLFSSLLILSTSSIADDSNRAVELPQKLIELHELLTNDECDVEVRSMSQVYDVSSNQKLYIIACVMAPYNTAEYVYLWDKFSGYTPVSVLDMSSIPNSKGKVITERRIMGASYDPQTKILSSFSKGRGVGDCGTSSEHKLMYNEEGTWVQEIRTVEIRNKQKCDGRVNKKWPIVFKQ